MSYERDAKELAALNLLEKIIDTQSDKQRILAVLGAQFGKKHILGHAERILAIIGTSGAGQNNIKLRNSLKELNMEIVSDNPHFETIEFLLVLVLNSYYDAVGDQYANWDFIDKDVILKAFGKYGLDPEIMGYRRKKKKKRYFRRKHDDID